MNKYKQLPLVALDSALVELGLTKIQDDLVRLAPDAVVVASQIEEFGYTIVLEGPVSQVYAVISEWESGK